VAQLSHLSVAPIFDLFGEKEKELPSTSTWEQSNLSPISPRRDTKRQNSRQLLPPLGTGRTGRFANQHFGKDSFFKAQAFSSQGVVAN
jgi:hypothetical protein